MKLICLLTVALLSGQAWADEAVLTKGQSLKVMPLGDSITFGKDQCLGGYRRPLYEWLIANGYPIKYVGKQNVNVYTDKPDTINNASDGSTLWHEGYGSFRTDMILNGGEAEGQTAPPIATTIGKYKPDIVLLMIGTNDILQNFQFDTAPDRLREILEAIRVADPKTIVLVSSLTPIDGPADDPRFMEWTPRVALYNAAIPGIVAKQKALGQHVIFVDVNAAFPQPGAIRGVHPDDNAYARIASVWYKALTGEDAPAIDQANPLLLPASSAP